MIVWTKKIEVRDTVTCYSYKIFALASAWFQDHVLLQMCMNMTPKKYLSLSLSRAGVLHFMNYLILSFCTEKKRVLHRCFIKKISPSPCQFHALVSRKIKITLFSAKQGLTFCLNRSWLNIECWAILNHKYFYISHVKIVHLKKLKTFRKT